MTARFGDVWATTYSATTYSGFSLAVMAVTTDDNHLTKAIVLKSTDPIFRTGEPAEVHIITGWEQLKEGTK